MTDTISEHMAAHALKLLGPPGSIRRMRWLLAFDNSRLDPGGDACRALFHFIGEDEPEPVGEMAQALWREMLEPRSSGVWIDADEMVVLEQRMEEAMGERNDAKEQLAALATRAKALCSKLGYGVEAEALRAAADAALAPQVSARSCEACNGSGVAGPHLAACGVCKGTGTQATYESTLLEYKRIADKATGYRHELAVALRRASQLRDLLDANGIEVPE